MGYKTISHVNTQVDGGTANTDTVVITKPTGLAVGDLMLGFFLSAVDAVTSPAGWTQYDSDDNTNMRSVIFYKVATSGDVAATNFTFTAASALGPFCGGISAYRGVNQSNPINVSAQNILNVGTDPVTTPTAVSTEPGLCVNYRAVRIGSATIPTSTGSGNERADFGNHGASTAYQMAWYDTGTTVLAGSNTGISIDSSGTVTQSANRQLVLEAEPLDSTDSGVGTESESFAPVSFGDSDSGVGTDTERIDIPVEDSDSGVGTEGAENIVATTHHYFGDNFDRSDETSLTISSSGAVWTSA